MYLQENVRKASDLEREIRAVKLDRNKAEANLKVRQWHIDPLYNTQTLFITHRPSL